MIQTHRNESKQRKLDSENGKDQSVNLASFYWTHGPHCQQMQASFKLFSPYNCLTTGLYLLRHTLGTSSPIERLLLFRSLPLCHCLYPQLISRLDTRESADLLDKHKSMRALRLFSTNKRLFPTRSMSNFTVASIKRVSAKTLSEKILAEQEQAEPSFAVVDVRDVGMSWLGLPFSLHFSFNALIGDGLMKCFKLVAYEST